MHKVRYFVFFIVLVLFSVDSVYAEKADEFQKQLDDLKSPIQSMLETGKAYLRVGDTFYLPFIEKSIIPTDQFDNYESKMSGSASVSDPNIVSVSKNGLISVLSNGNATITYKNNNQTMTLEIIADDSNQPIAIQNLIYIANYEYLSTAMNRLPKYNKYAKWYYKKKKEVGWCSVFSSYVTNASGLPTFKHDTIALDSLSANKAFGLLEGQVGNQWEGFDSVDRFTNIPKPGYYVIYGNRKNAYKHTHIGLVVDVKAVGNGFYKIRTVEGNMSNTVKSYVYLYDSKISHPKENMFETDSNDRENSLFQYTLHTDYWSVFGFCATWE